MYIDYQHLLSGSAPSLRFGPATASRIDGLLAQAKGCVVGRQRGRPFVEINVDGAPQRVEFDRDADLGLLLARVEARGIPLHRDREVTAAVLGMGAVLILAIALAVWLRP
ncbi:MULTISPECIES: hypothetical protein [unclassified Mesorhizobium]|uniref:hypothetical protein n=1 Tax=unclassified Mesorhizobium TaxID=325217 RepID=UPI000FD7D9A4|nr:MULTISPECIES: hypothetical protein [unclassified Mesorhizobium]TGT65659.1 hypothetical protein EN809_033080 [Mesorhizobium sp. M2E.F.Ca.ET.166.01.1.1]TGV97704.1 hypothetical protein EN797_033090 [Mesorhizobium sp. M2E.F.Ca.ET.154.01.1.1]